ncbi:Membrane-bound metallopeptidase [Variovorax sp. HW608]|uniref:murein hydrolase activator EnvC family protein n=1 Tax=Variovorax sp. HW608 TaxID=1034889 RepID=UPI00081FE9F2|nr:peptidoglycan DD-metalloendopeptidase family protein [Variovorax sp. HW608]SCK11837.1 Membrane-bound metallopeptidase [Variovorax sp. HW608]
MQERVRAIRPSTRTGQFAHILNRSNVASGLRAGFGALICTLVVACGTSPKEPPRSRAEPQAAKADASADAETPKPRAKQSDPKRKSSAARSAAAGKSGTSKEPRVAASPSPGRAAGTFLWPASGQVTGRFNGGTNKGIDIRGNAGDPVVAAAGGRVVYVGSKLRGWGNLVMVKHDDEFITAYAHNRKILVRENEQVKPGQQIAEMGSSDSNATQLHFEIRRKGNAVDPMPYLKAQPPAP